MGIKVSIISVGKIKEKYIQLGIDEFSKRLKRFCSLELIELRDEPIYDKASEKELEIIRKKEAEQIISKISRDSFIITMDIEGKSFSSEELATQIKNTVTYGKSHITFIIGGSVGLAHEIKKSADLRLSFSKMTFPHQLFKLILLEQLYRCFKINSNESYHK